MRVGIALKELGYTCTRTEDMAISGWLSNALTRRDEKHHSLKRTTQIFPSFLG
ncbi:MAG: hypothetical protein ACLR6J_12745 [Parabacteroides merdae]